MGTRRNEVLAPGAEEQDKGTRLVRRAGVVGVGLVLATSPAGDSSHRVQPPTLPRNLSGSVFEANDIGGCINE